MKKRIVSFMLAVILCLSLLPVAVLADRAVINAIEATSSSFKAPKVGESVVDSYDFATGTGAYFDGRMRGWQRLDPATGRYLDYTGTVFTAGTYRFHCQIRVDSIAGQSYYLGNPLTVKVNGESWETTNPYVSSTYSYAWTSSPEYTLDLSVPSISVVGINEPVIGQHPDTTATIVADALYGLSASVQWVKFVNGLGYDMNAWDVFEAGYRYGCYLTFTSDYGCSFPSQPVVGAHGSINYEYTGDFSINGVEQKAYVYPDEGVCKATWWLQPAKDKATLPFTDVKESDYFFEPVLWAVTNGITAGTSATKFSPNDSCTRAQVVTFLWRAAGCPEPKSIENPFTDVKEGKSYTDAVLWAVSNGITTGTSETTFGTNQGCTRAQVVTFLWRAAGCPTPQSTENPFTDVKEGKSYTNAVLWAVENGITTGTSETTFAPQSTCTRAHVVTFLYRAAG